MSMQGLVTEFFLNVPSVDKSGPKAGMRVDHFILSSGGRLTIQDNTNYDIQVAVRGLPKGYKVKCIIARTDQLILEELRTVQYDGQAIFFVRNAITNAAQYEGYAISLAAGPENPGVIYYDRGIQFFGANVLQPTIEYKKPPVYKEWLFEIVDDDKRPRTAEEEAEIRKRLEEEKKRQEEEAKRIAGPGPLDPSQFGKDFVTNLGNFFSGAGAAIGPHLPLILLVVVGVIAAPHIISGTIRGLFRN